MSRDEFMVELEKELQDISQLERDNALLYYKNYFDDAGAENEADVISKLDSPRVIAQEIRRDLGESAKAAPAEAAAPAAPAAPAQPAAPPAAAYTHPSGGADGSTGTDEKAKEPFFSQNVEFLGMKLPVWALILLAVVFIPVILPVVSGIAGTAVGIVFGAVGCAIGFFAASVGLIIGGLVSLVTGIISAGTGELFNGILLSGAGLFLLGLGMLMFTLSIQLFAVWIPQFVRWIIQQCKKAFGRKPAMEGGAA